MKKIKFNPEKYKKKDNKLCKTAWQQYAKDTCQDFGVIHPYDKIVFKYAKSNLSFLKAQVTNLQEQANYKGESTKTYGRLLTYKLNKTIKKKTPLRYCLRRCTRCGKPIKEQWTALTWTENWKIQKQYRHVKCT